MDTETQNLPEPVLPAKEYWEDSAWADAHYTELVKMYPDMWVTVIDRKVHAAGHDPKEIILRTETETGRKEFPILFIEKGIRVYTGYAKH